MQRQQTDKAHAMLEESGYVPPDFIRIPYYNSSLCPDPEHRVGTLTRIARGGEAGGQGNLDPILRDERRNQGYSAAEREVGEGNQEVGYRI